MITALIDQAEALNQQALWGDNAELDAALDEVKNRPPRYQIDVEFLNRLEARKKPAGSPHANA